MIVITYLGKPVHLGPLILGLMSAALLAFMLPYMLQTQQFSLTFLLFAFVAVISWGSIIIQRVEIREEGILFIGTTGKKSTILRFGINEYHSFDNIMQLRFFGPLLRIKKKKGGSSYWLMIPKGGFVEEVRRYAPQELV